MPWSKLFVRPKPLGLELLLTSDEINWKVYAQIVREIEQD